MKITIRLILSFLLVSVIPLGLMGYLLLEAMDNMRSLAIDESTAALQQSGEKAIEQKAVDIAHQIELYLAIHPELRDATPQQWNSDGYLATIAIQHVGMTGWTGVFDERGIVYLHDNPDMVGLPLVGQSGQQPGYRAILEAGLDGSPSSGYYKSRDVDGSIRDKYTSVAPVSGTPYRVVASTYIDEFYRPIRRTEASITGIFNTARRSLIGALAALAVMALALGLTLALGISRPIRDITAAVRGVEAGDFAIESLARTARRGDELCQLARTFQRMAGQVYKRETSLKEQVQLLRIEIDEAKKQRQVEEITESEYFQRLLEKVEELRLRHRTD